MSKNLTLDDLDALSALRLLTRDFGELPAPSVDVSPLFPRRLRLLFHDTLSDFEAWREALGIAADDVDYHEQDEGRTLVLQAATKHAGALVELTAFGDVYATGVHGGAA